MNIKLILIVFYAFCIQVYAQRSYSTSLAFRLFDEDNELVDLETFQSDYTIANVFGDIMNQKDLKSFLYYDAKTNYFTFQISTIGPRFSFAIYHRNTTMTLFIPFVRARKSRHQYALDIKIIEGDYLLDFNIKNKRKLILNGNIPYNRIEKVNWKKQKRKFLKSKYYGQQKLYRNDNS